MTLHSSTFRLALAVAFLSSACTGTDPVEPDPGTGGTAGNAGSAGAAGSMAGGGAAGSAGALGKGGTAGAAGAAGSLSAGGSSAAGSGGLGGAGMAGSVAGGAAGTGGATAGSAGTAGSTSGSGGVAGSSGAAGSAGAAGNSGAAGGGAGGQGGLAGAAGAAGSAGTGGSAGFAPCPGTGPCIILPFGDSITDGVGMTGGGGYRVELFSLALADDHEITFVGSLQNGPQEVDGEPFPRRHEGHSGWRIAQLPPLIPSPAFTTVPHIVLLHIGTNDIAQNDNLSQAPARLAGLIDDIIEAAPDALVVVAQLIPLNFGGSNAVQTYNAEIPELVEERAADGKHVIMVDQFEGFPLSELPDNVHPNEAGYARMAGVWYQAIEPYLR